MTKVSESVLDLYRALDPRSAIDLLGWKYQDDFTILLIFVPPEQIKATNPKDGLLEAKALVYKHFSRIRHGLGGLNLRSPYAGWYFVWVETPKNW